MTFTVLCASTAKITYGCSLELYYGWVATLSSPPPRYLNGYFGAASAIHIF